MFDRLGLADFQPWQWLGCSIAILNLINGRLLVQDDDHSLKYIQEPFWWQVTISPTSFSVIREYFASLDPSVHPNLSANCMPSCVTTRYGLLHYAHMIRQTCYFSLCLPFSSSTLCLIHTDKLTSLLIPSLVRYALFYLQIFAYSNYAHIFVTSYIPPLFLLVYKGMYL